MAQTTLAALAELLWQLPLAIVCRFIFVSFFL
jgi:hypothetical protein